MLLQIEVNGRFHQTFPGGHVGVLLIGNVDNRKRLTPLDQKKREIEARLRQKFAGFSRADLLELEILPAYRDYYKQFKKTYHVQLQLESIVHKGKSLPSVSPLVDANFAAAVETLVLTPGALRGLCAGGVPVTAVQQQLDQIHKNILLFAPEARPELTEIYAAGNR